MKLLVLHISGELAPWRRGGIATVVQGLANAMAQKSSMCTAILGTVPSGAGLTKAGYAPSLLDYAVRLSRWPQPIRRVALQLAYLVRLKEWYSAALTEPDGVPIVHAHLLPGFRLFPVICEAVRLGLPIVQTVYDWAPLEAPYYPLVKRLGLRAHWLVAQLLLYRATVFTANSRFIADRVRRRWPRHPVHVVPNGVELPPESRGGSSCESACRLFFWGELYSKKGPLIFLAALRRLLDTDPGLRWEARLGGDGPQRKLVHETVLRLGLQERVKVLGGLSPEELATQLAASDLVVLPSAYEGFGMAVLEAMAAGKPVITTNRGGAAEIICRPEQGRLVDRTPESIAVAIRDLCQSPARRSQMARAARQRAAEYSWESIVARFEAIYREAVQLRQP